jgi:hypothetical protein
MSEYDWGPLFDAINGKHTYRMRRVLLGHVVGYDDTFHGGWFSTKWHWTKKGATAHLVELALKGEKVKL